MSFTVWWMGGGSLKLASQEQLNPLSNQNKCVSGKTPGRKHLLFNGELFRLVAVNLCKC